VNRKHGNEQRNCLAEHPQSCGNARECLWWCASPGIKFVCTM